jgi:saccharopine dehydrogenase-like NADP-dependent oxidoreductase
MEASLCDVSLATLMQGKGPRRESTAQFLYELVDFYGEREHITAMARTTAYTGAIATIMLAKKQISRKGVVSSEIVFAGRLFQDFMKQLAGENVKISRVEMTRTQDITR